MYAVNVITLHDGLAHKNLLFQGEDRVRVGKAAEEAFTAQLLECGITPASADELHQFLEDGWASCGAWMVFISWPELAPLLKLMPPLGESDGTSLDEGGEVTLWMGNGKDSPLLKFDNIHEVAGVLSGAAGFLGARLLSRPVTMHGERGIDLPLRAGDNYVRLFWGDKDAKFVSSITCGELTALINAAQPDD